MEQIISVEQIVLGAAARCGGVSLEVLIDSKPKSLSKKEFEADVQSLCNKNLLIRAVHDGFAKYHLTENGWDLLVKPKFAKFIDLRDLCFLEIAKFDTAPSQVDFRTYVKNLLDFKEFMDLKISHHMVAEEIERSLIACGSIVLQGNDPNAFDSQYLCFTELGKKHLALLRG